jgi:tetratricopeptide (TPR) repeat protein
LLVGAGVLWTGAALLIAAAPAHALPSEIQYAHKVCADGTTSAQNRVKSCSKLILAMKTGALVTSELRLRDIYVSRALAYQGLGERNDALEDIDHATDLIQQDLDPRLIGNERYGWQPYFVYLLRGQMEIDAGKYQEALGSLVQAVRHVEKSADQFPSEGEKLKAMSQIVGSIGVAQASLGNADDALAALDLAIEQDAGNAKAYLARAAVHKSLGHADLSEADMVRARALGK